MKKKQYFGEFLKTPTNNHTIEFEKLVSKGMKFGVYLALGAFSTFSLFGICYLLSLAF